MKDPFSELFEELDPTAGFEPQEESEERPPQEEEAPEELWEKPAEEERSKEEMPAEAAPALIFRRDHRETELPREAVERIAESLGMSVAETVETLQKGCNYDRMLQREGIPAAERRWVDFFKRHRELEAESLPQGMLERIRDGYSPEEAYLDCRLRDAEQEREMLRAHTAAASRSPGSVSPETAQQKHDPFEEAFDRALRG